MNKVILGLLVAVCVLGMALIMLNERMRKPEPANPAGIIAPVTSPDAAPPADAGNQSTTSPSLHLPPQTQSGIPDLNASGEAPARAPIPSLKPEEKSAPTSNVAAAEPQPAVAKPVVQPKPATPVTEKTAPAAEPAKEKAPRGCCAHCLQKYATQRP